MANSLKKMLIAIVPRCLQRHDAAAYVGQTPTKFGHLVKKGVLPGPMNLDACEIELWDRRALDEAIDRIGKSSNDALSEHDLDVGLGLADH